MDAKADDIEIKVVEKKNDKDQEKDAKEDLVNDMKIYDLTENYRGNLA